MSNPSKNLPEPVIGARYATWPGSQHEVVGIDCVDGAIERVHMRAIGGAHVAKYRLDGWRRVIGKMRPVAGKDS